MKPDRRYSEQGSRSTDDWKVLRFVGIGGIGMSALARYFNERGESVSGYDRTASPLTAKLVEEGMKVEFEANPEAVKAADVVIYTPAVPSDHTELEAAREAGIPLLKRSAVLGELSRDRFTIAVAGSHGKTTVSSMIAHILQLSGYGCTAFLGGIATNFNSNYIGGKDDVVVVEADEFDRSFLQLEPDIAVVTAIDTDHLDVYGDQASLEAAFIEFVQQVKDGGKLIAKWALPVHDHFRGISRSYSLGEDAADWFASELEVSALGSRFKVNRISQSLALSWPGIHNVENAIAAAAVAALLDIPDAKIAEALASFKGISRRFQVRHWDASGLYVDDYAHHPEEIRALLNSIRSITKEEITVIFQPHLFTRTRDLADGFAEALSLAHRVILLPIYPAREEPIGGVSSSLIASRISDSSEVKLMIRDEVLDYLSKGLPPVLLTVGAGDIDRITDAIADLYRA